MYQYGVCGIVPMGRAKHPEMQLLRVDYDTGTVTFLDTVANEIVEVSGTKEISRHPASN